MNEEKLNEEINEIYKGLKLLDMIIPFDHKNDNKRYLTERQCEIVEKVFNVLKTLGWQLSFNNYKELKYDENTKSIDTRNCGKLVKIRPCGKEYNNKTYLGILIGEVALSISHTIKEGIVTAKHSMHNPAIFVPELKKIIYGCESWWGEIENEEDLKDITNDIINNTWYVQLLKDMSEKGDKEDE